VIAPVLHLVGSRSAAARTASVLVALHRVGVRQRVLHVGTGEALEVTDHLGPPRTLAALGCDETGASAATTGVEQAITRIEPGLLLVADESDATVAGALTAAKLGIPVARIGAGARCHDWGLPEEVNRVVLDEVAALRFADSDDAADALAAEGHTLASIHTVGSTLADNVARWRQQALARSAGTDLGTYVLVTLHRRENLADAARVSGIAAALSELVRRYPVVLVLHPRTRAALAPTGALDRLRADGVVIHDPLGYVEFLSLAAGAGAVLTDSGGLQEEATALGVRCFTFRRTTDRTATLLHGSNLLLGDDPAEIRHVAPSRCATSEPIPLWDGHAGERIAAVLVARLDTDGAVR
jgi:UDP-N-acetylglucosamine 2-epimerase (non-hydrolysing)